MSPYSSSTQVDVTLITYSYSPKSFETPNQAPTYTSFTFNTERSVRHALAYWINVGAGHYGDIDLLFCGGISQPHWSGLPEQEVLVMEIDLRQRKVETVVQIVESLEEVWRIGMYYATQDNFYVTAKKLEKISSFKREPLADLSSIFGLEQSQRGNMEAPSYGSTPQIHELETPLTLRQKYDQSISSSAPASAFHFGPARSRSEKTPSQKDLDFDGASDDSPGNPFAAFPDIQQREESTSFPELCIQNSVDITLDYWAEKNKNHALRDLDYLRHLCSEEFERDGVGG